MASTNFSYGTVIASTWLNDVNTAVYTTLPTLAPKISPAFTTPSLGVATATSINKNTFSTPATNCTWTLADGKTLTVNNTITINGTDGSTLNIGSGGTLTPAIFNTTGTNTGDQLTFKTVAVTGQTSAIATTTSDTLTLTAGTGIGLATSGNTITFTSGQTIQLLGQATVSSAVANIDFLNSFSSIYDNYIIDIVGVVPSGADALGMKVAIGGTLDSGSNYYRGVSDGTAISSASSYYLITPTNASATGGGASIKIDIMNANTVRQKGIIALGSYFGTGGYPAAVITSGAWTGSGVVSGIRLYWTAGSTFTAGTVRVFGIKNT